MKVFLGNQKRSGAYFIPAEKKEIVAVDIKEVVLQRRKVNMCLHCVRAGSAQLRSTAIFASQNVTLF